MLIIGHTFPEPTTTAAGGRMMQLISIFQENGYDITFASTAAGSEYSEDLELIGVSRQSIVLNDPSFDALVKKLNPNVVLFDRFITEEQFGWRITENCPEALKILDTEDLHFLRKAREEAFRQHQPLDLYADMAKRELASILKCDLSLIISETEIQLLTETFQIPKELLYYLPLMVSSFSRSTPAFEERQHFICIGNLLHAPNLDSMLYIKNELWPHLRKRLPEALLHIYGAYATQTVMAMHNEKEGFFVEGWAKDIKEVMQKSRVCLAPLRFGAGLKGKLLDAAQYGTPSVTTDTGIEGMCGELPFGGLVGHSKNALIEAAIELYTNKKEWTKAQTAGFEMVEKRFQKIHFAGSFADKIADLRKRIKEHRRQHFMGQILQHQSFLATKYLSKWIEEKRQKNNDK